jgi:hypothetical protein
MDAINLAQEVAASDRSPPILLKNCFSTDDGKILGAIRREARFRLGEIHEGVGVAM